MKKINFQIGLMFLILLSTTPVLFAQGGPPPGGRRGGFDPAEMVKREKQNVYKVITDLTNDQKMLLDGIYEEFAVSIEELRDEVRQTRDFQAMRPKMLALREEKDDLIKDVLNENQFMLYQDMMDKQQIQRRKNMQRNNDQKNKTKGTPPDKSGDLKEQH